MTKRVATSMQCIHMYIVSNNLQKSSSEPEMKPDGLETLLGLMEHIYEGL